MRRTRGFTEASCDIKDCKFAIFGVPYDATSSFRPGSRFAPQSIRESSWNFEIYSPKHNVNLRDIGICDMGDIEDVWRPSDVEKEIEYMLSQCLNNNCILIALGGEHSISPFIVKSLKKNFGELGVIVLDAHLDMRDEYMGNKWSHACASRRISEIVDEILIGGVRTCSKSEEEFFESEISFPYNGENIWSHDFIKLIGEKMDELPLYLSIDMDVFDPSYAPGVANPEPMGINPMDAIKIINEFSDRWVGMDVVECCPPHDIGITSILSARLVLEFIYSSSKSFNFR